MTTSRAIGTLALGAALTLTLSACGFFFGGGLSGFSLGALDGFAPAGGTGAFHIAVSGMPGGGLAALSIDADGVSFDPATIEITRIEGVGDVVVRASAIDNASGTFGFGAVNPAGGLVEGKVVRITFRALKPTTSPVVIDEAKVVAGDVANARLTGFELAAGVAGGFESRFPTALRPGATTHP